MYLAETFSGGLVTSLDPAFLEPGELSVANNAFYFPNDTAIYRAPGYALFGYFPSSSAASQALSAAFPIRFGGGQQYIVAQSADSLYYIDPDGAAGGAPSLLTSYTTGDDISAVHYKNRWYVFNGVNDNVVVKEGPSARPHGLLPVTAPATSSTTAAVFALDTSGTYEYWHTEVAKYSDDDEVESAFTGTPVKVLISDAATEAPKLTFSPKPINEGLTTHYRIYRGASRFVAGEPSAFPIGYQVGEIAIADGSWTNGGTAANSSGWAAAYDPDEDAPYPARASGNGRRAGEFLNETRATAASNSSGAVYTAGAYTGTAGGGVGRMFTVYNFGLLPVGNILGVTVDINMQCSHPTKTSVFASLVERGATANSCARMSKATSQYPNGIVPRDFRKQITTLPSSWTVCTLGSATDDWLPANYDWTADVVASSAFGVALWAQFDETAPTTATVEIDSVKVTVRHNGSNDDEFGKVYDAITLELDGEAVSCSANTPPPRASVGTVFQGSLVTNDVDNPRRIVWSSPGNADAFPTEVYYLDDFGGNLNDEITYIGTVQGRCVVGMGGSVWRVGYLPNENDASISRGDAVTPLSTAVGIANPRAACSFTWPDGGEGLAFAGATGVYATDGLSVIPLAAGLDWTRIVGAQLDATRIQRLVNDPGTQTLRLLLVSGNEYVMSYARSHRTRFGGKWTGPNTRRYGTRIPSDVCSVRLANYAHALFYVYTSTATTGAAAIAREDAADIGYINPIQAGSGAGMLVSTRDIYPGGLDGEVRVHDVMWYGEVLEDGAATISPDCGVLLYKRFLRGATSTESGESSTSASGGKLLFASFTEGRCAGFGLGFVPATTEFTRLYGCYPNVEPFGSSDNA